MRFRSENHHSLPGLYNLRDAGGYRTIDRRVVRRRRIWRSDSPHSLDSSGQAALRALGIRTLIDLRTTVETTRQPLRLAPDSGLRYRHRPLFEDWRALLHEGEAGPDLIRYNELLLDRCQPALRAVFEEIAAPETGAVLIYCTAGKDRTGLVIALLLALAGVPTATITADYAASYHYLAPLLAQLRSNIHGSGNDPAAKEEILRSPPLVMWRTLEYLRLSYGGAAAYVAQIGVTKETIYRLQALLLSENPLLPQAQTKTVSTSSASQR